MEQVTIKNNILEVKVALLGAEVQEVKNLEDGFSYIWDADSKYWGRHAPILFPFIGRSNDNQYLIDGQKYDMKQHGFLREQTFTVVDQTESQVTLQSESTDETLAVYPYHYVVKITYQLEENQLKISYQIENQNDSEMYYSFGFHPGLKITSEMSDYALMFNPQVQSLKTLEIDPAPFRNGEVSETKLNNGKLSLSYPMLDDGLIIYDVQDIMGVTLTSSKDDHTVSENITDFPYLAIWSPEKKKAPFICVEPFRGLPDKYGQTIEISQKDGEQEIASHQSDEFSVKMIFN